MTIKNLNIKRKEGIVFAKKSGDNNKIHIDYLTGYNSLYGDNVVHGCYVLIKFLELVHVTKFKSLKINFFRGIFYEIPLKIKLIKKNNTQHVYELFQDAQLKASIVICIKNNNNQIDVLNKTTFKKTYKINKKIRDKFENIKIDKDINLSLNYLTKYAGTVYPGKYSIISEIIIRNDKNFNSDDVKIKSNRISSRHSLIHNYFSYKQYKFFFQTYIRPHYLDKRQKISKNLLNEVNSKKNSILIIGASSGIGNDIFKLFKKNNKIKIIGTFNKNKIINNQKNVIIKKIDIKDDINKIALIIKKNKPLFVYYFATPKIDLKNNSKKFFQTYSKFYVTIPIKIIKICIINKSYFFYPSSTFIDEKKNNLYSNLKKSAEIKIKKIKDNEKYVSILRIPEINTKQNISILNKKLPNFTDLLNKDKTIRNSFFFKK